jgi:hypothetical protein
VETPDSNETYGDLTFKVRPTIPAVRELQFEGFLLHAPEDQCFHQYLRSLHILARLYEAVRSHPLEAKVQQYSII